MKEYDVVVVGGAFAGLNFAKAASSLENLKVLLIENKEEIGKNVNSTGIFISDVLDLF